MLYLVQRQRVAVSWFGGDGGAEGQPASAAEVKPTRENREGDEQFLDKKIHLHQFCCQSTDVEIETCP